MYRLGWETRIEKNTIWRIIKTTSHELAVTYLQVKERKRQVNITDIGKREVTKSTRKYTVTISTINLVISTKLKM